MNNSRVRFGIDTELIAECVMPDLHHNFAIADNDALGRVDARHHTTIGVYIKYEHTHTQAHAALNGTNISANTDTQAHRHIHKKYVVVGIRYITPTIRPADQRPQYQATSGSTRAAEHMCKQSNM